MDIKKSKVIKTSCAKLNKVTKNGEDQQITANIVLGTAGTVNRKPVNVFGKQSCMELTEFRACR